MDQSIYHDPKETFLTGNQRKTMFLIDTNILIYSIQGNAKAISALKKIENQPALISVISKLEVLYGALKEKKSIPQILEYVDAYAALAIDNTIVMKAFDMLYKDGVNLKFKDLLIAATAKEHDFTVLTADKDFKNLKGVKVELIKV